MSKYVISGASGKTGRKVAEYLLKAGQSVTVITRNRRNVQALEAAGATVAVGSTDDLAFVTETLKGARALFALIPVDPTSMDQKTAQTAHVTALAEALKHSDVTHVVGLSSYGVSLKEHWGIVYGLHMMEEAFNAISSLNTMFLRASYFMENSLGLVAAVKKFGVMAAPIRADLKFPAVSTPDLARRAAQLLQSLSFTGKHVENALGPRMVSYPEIARVYGTAIGKPDLQFKQVSMDDFKNVLVNVSGMSPNIAEHYAEYTQQMNDGRVYSAETKPTPETTPTTIEDFAKVFATVYNSTP